MTPLELEPKAKAAPAPIQEIDLHPKEWKSERDAPKRTCEARLVMSA